MKASLFLRKKGFILLLAASFVLFSLSGCGQKARSASARPQQDLTSVKVVPAAVSDIVVNVEQSCKLKAAQEIIISPELAGKVTSISADVGTKVTKGQVLFTLDTTDLQTQMKQQQANLDYYIANLAKTKDSSNEEQLSTAAQTLSKAQYAFDDAKANYDKNLLLYQSGAISQQDLADYDTKLKNATIDLNSAQDSFNTMKNESNPQSVDAANAQVTQANASVESVSTKLTSSIVRSPIDGIVSVRNVDPGEMVSESSQTFTVIDSSSLIAELDLSDDMASKIQKDMQVPIKIGNTQSVQGVVDTISPSTNSNTQLFTVDIKVPNTDNSLKPGSFATVLLPAESKQNVVTVPNQAVKIDGGVEYVYIVQNGKVKKQPVTVGLANEEITEITSNIKAGDQVILEGQVFLNDGQKVKVVK